MSLTTDELRVLFAPLFKRIRAVETGRPDPASYDIYYGGIRASDAPPARLTQMTIQQVLDWQDSIDRKYMSEASGAYQIMEDTLRGMVPRGDHRRNMRFDANMQDELARLLLGYGTMRAFVEGRLSVAQMGLKIARIWASFPVLQTTPRKGKRAAGRGESYYGGDGLNKALVPAGEVEMLLASIYNASKHPIVAKAAKPAPRNPFAALLALLAKIFGRKK